MPPLLPRDDSQPELQVNVIGTANPNGEYMQHEAVVPNKAYSAVLDQSTVVVQSEPPPPPPPPPPSSSQEQDTMRTPEEDASGLLDAASSGDEITAVTKSLLRARGWGIYRTLTAIEKHRAAALCFAFGSVLLLLAAMLAIR